MSKNINGIILAVGDFPEGNATAMRLILIAKALKTAGIRVTVALLTATAKHDIPENKTTTGTFDGVEFIYLNGSTVRPIKLLQAAADTLRGIGGALRLIMRRWDAAFRPDFVLLYTPTLFRHGIPILATLLRRIPIFVEVCEIESSSTPKSRNSVLKDVFNSMEWIMEWLIPHIAIGLIPISQQIADFFRLKGVEKDDIFLLPILVDTNLYLTRSTFEIASLVNKKYFLNSGSFDEKDGVTYMVKAFINVARENPDLYLVFTGLVSEQNKAEVVSILSKNYIPERALFVGMLSRAELAWAYQNAVGLLCCRTNSEYANYGFPTKLGEYLASGTPVIATMVSDIKLYLKDGVTAYLALPENPDSIAQCMKKIMDYVDESRLVGRNGQHYVQEHFEYTRLGNSLSCFIKARLLGDA